MVSNEGATMQKTWQHIGWNFNPEMDVVALDLYAYHEDFMQLLAEKSGDEENYVKNNNNDIY
jgi:hypothetical protein